MQQKDPKLLQVHLRCSANTPVQQKDPKLLQVHLRCSANKTIVDGIDGKTLVYIYIYIYILADLALALCVIRWIAKCGVQRGRHMGKLEQQNGTAGVCGVCGTARTVG